MISESSFLTVLHATREIFQTVYYTITGSWRKIWNLTFWNGLDKNKQYNFLVFKILNEVGAEALSHQNNADTYSVDTPNWHFYAQS